MTMKKDYKVVLTSMGYRPMDMKNLKKGKMWMKPVAFCTISCYEEDDTLKFALHMKGRDVTPLIWKTYNIDLREYREREELDLTYGVKLAEESLFTSTTPLMENGSDSHYEFLTPLDRANILTNVIG